MNRAERWRDACRLLDAATVSTVAPTGPSRGNSRSNVRGAPIGTRSCSNGGAVDSARVGPPPPRVPGVKRAEASRARKIRAYAEPPHRHAEQGEKSEHGGHLRPMRNEAPRAEEAF